MNIIEHATADSHASLGFKVLHFFEGFGGHLAIVAGAINMVTVVTMPCMVLMMVVVHMSANGNCSAACCRMQIVVARVLRHSSYE